MGEADESKEFPSSLTYRPDKRKRGKREERRCNEAENLTFRPFPYSMRSKSATSATSKI
jgi:hypothetical protein